MVTSGGVRLRQLVVVTVVVGLLGLVVLRLLGGTVPSPGWPGAVSYTHLDVYKRQAGE